MSAPLVAMKIDKIESLNVDIESVEKHLNKLKDERLKSYKDLCEIMNAGDPKQHTNDFIMTMAYRFIGLQAHRDNVYGPKMQEIK